MKKYKTDAAIHPAERAIGNALLPCRGVVRRFVTSPLLHTKRFAFVSFCASALRTQTRFAAMVDGCTLRR
ncbi:MAG: hypothetical protein IPM64_10115 [Phycisphaerales bacterium]|nr:hypothetical protein [Phycisphaerales bacterium]